MYGVSAQSVPGVSVRSGDPNSLRDAFLSVMVGEKRPGGIVMVQKVCSSEQSSSTKVIPNGNFDERIDYLIKVNLCYRSTQDGNVTNLLPVDYEPSFLKMRINRFIIDTGLKVDLTVEKLLSLDELKSEADAIRLNKGLEFGGLQSPPVRKSKVVHISDLTVREALNQIAVAYGSYVWVYSETVCDGKQSTTLRFPVQVP